MQDEWGRGSCSMTRIAVSATRRIPVIGREPLRRPPPIPGDDFKEVKSDCEFSRRAVRINQAAKIARRIIDNELRVLVKPLSPSHKLRPAKNPSGRGVTPRCANGDSRSSPDRLFTSRRRLIIASRSWSEMKWGQISPGHRTQACLDCITFIVCALVSSAVPIFMVRFSNAIAA